MKINYEFNDIISVFGSRAKAQEVFLLLADKKELVRQGFYEEETLKVLNFCKENNIFVIKSKFKVVVEEDGKINYSNKGKVVDILDKRRGMLYFYMSKSEEKAYLGALFEIENNVKKFGEVLGYPNCCVEYFFNNWSSKHSNPEQKPTNPFTNITRRKEDFVLLSHFPCSSDCPKSINMGKMYLEEIKKHDEHYSNKLFKELKVK